MVLAHEPREPDVVGSERDLETDAELLMASSKIISDSDRNLQGSMIFQTWPPMRFAELPRKSMYVVSVLRTRSTIPRNLVGGYRGDRPR